MGQINDPGNLNKPRRGDRAIDDEAWIRDFLARVPHGVLATVHDGQPFLNPNTFVYDPEAHAVYLHTAREGRTRANVAAHPKVCFSAADMGRLLPAKEAMHFSVEYESAIIFGRASIVTDPIEAKRALQLMLDKYFPHLRPDRDYRSTTAEELAMTTVFRIDVDSWSAKSKKVADDFPGAFQHGDQGR